MNFASVKQAIGYAVATHTRAAGWARMCEHAAATALDPLLGVLVWACVRRAGLDPHHESPELREIVEWATTASGVVKLGARAHDLLELLEHELVAVGLLPVETPGAGRRPDAGPEKLPPWIGVRLTDTGTVTYCASHRQPTARQLDAWAAVVLEQRGVIEDADELLARRWGCAERTARRWRQRALAVAENGEEATFSKDARTVICFGTQEP